MKLFGYISESSGFVQAKWLRMKLAILWILISSVAFGGIFLMNQPAHQDRPNRSECALVSENEILRHELSVIFSRTRNLEMRSKQLSEDYNRLHMLLRASRSGVDTMTRFADELVVNGSQSLRPVAAAFRP